MNDRQFNQAELRTASQLLWLTNKYTVRTIGEWVKQKKRPSTTELMRLTVQLLNINDKLFAMAKGRPSDGHSLDDTIAAL